MVFRRTLSEIKLKRTDTTLDLSQKAKRAKEKKKKREWKERWAGDSLYMSEKWSVREEESKGCKHVNNANGLTEAGSPPIKCS